MAEQVQKAEACQKALLSVRTSTRRAPLARSRNKSHRELAPYLSAAFVQAEPIRRPEDYVVKSHNPARQVIGLIDHLAVAYHVPFALYQTVLSKAGCSLVYGMDASRMILSPQREKLAPWFLALAQGWSLAKEAAAVLTRKEAHWLAQDPPVMSVEKIIAWSRLRAAGASSSLALEMVEEFGEYSLEGYAGQTALLAALWVGIMEEVPPRRHAEVRDFLKAVSGQGYRLAGRTPGSVLKQSLEWHRQPGSLLRVQYRSWARRLPLWEKRQGKSLVRAMELTNNRLLHEEGKAMKHCVYSYTEDCAGQDAAIVSLRWHPQWNPWDAVGPAEKRITVEVRLATMRIVQARGLCNRDPSEDEQQVLTQWASDMGLAIRSRAW